MLIGILQSLFNRDLTKLKAEIALYQTEKQLWAVDKNIANSAGNLCLHLIGNLNTYIGAALGKTGYIRNRPLEFSAKDFRRDQLISEIEEAILMINDTLDKLTEADLESIYPQEFLEREETTGFFLVHLSTHLAYHLGQINYHRRMLDT